MHCKYVFTKIISQKYEFKFYNIPAQKCIDFRTAPHLTSSHCELKRFVFNIISKPAKTVLLFLIEFCTM